MSYRDLALTQIADRLRTFIPVQASTEGLRRATVVIALNRQHGQDGILLTRRSSGMREHPGQYVLPGGRAESGEDATAAGLRELAEELGVGLPGQDVLGRLDDYVTRSGYVITPIVCRMDEGHVVVANPSEVSSVHFVPFGDLLVAPRFVHIPQSIRPVIQLPLLGFLIHAPTGAILYQFTEVALRGRRTRVNGFEEPTVLWPNA